MEGVRIVEYKYTIEISGNRCFDLSPNTLIDVFSGRHPTDIINDPSYWLWKYTPIHENIKSDAISKIEEAGDGNLVIISKDLAEQYGISGRRAQRNNVIEIPENEYPSLQERLLEASQHNMLAGSWKYMVITMVKSGWELSETLSDLKDMRDEARAIKNGDISYLRKLREEVKDLSELLRDIIKEDEDIEELYHMLKKIRRDVHPKAKQVREDWDRRVLERVGDEVGDNKLVRVVPYSARIVDALI